MVELLENSGIRVTEVGVGPEDGALADAQMTVMAYEAARSRIHEYRHHRPQLSSHMRSLVESGLAIGRDRYAEALRLAARCREQLEGLLKNLDFVIAPSTPGEAPTPETTGDPVFSRMWTVMGLPAINLPAGSGEAGLPLGIQLTGGYRQDDLLVEQAVWFQQILSRSLQ